MSKCPSHPIFRIDPNLTKLSKNLKQPLAPKLGKNVWIHPSAQVIGRVTLKDYVNIWPGTVLRGDLHEIVIGRYSNIQDLSVVHLESYRGCYVGDYCVIGHSVILHGCTVKDGALVGMGAIIMNHAVVGESALIGAGALVPEGMKIKSESLYLGFPAKFVRKLSRKEVKLHVEWAKKYARLAQLHAKGMFKSAEVRRQNSEVRKYKL